MTNRYFACTTTPNTPDLANLQMAFWDLAVERFGRIKANAGQDGFCWSTFATEAAVVLVLAGTSISELLGQTTRLLKNGRVPPPKDAAATLYSPMPAPTAFNEFIDAYDAIRHFGHSKHQMVHGMMNDAGRERLCLLLNAAGDVWSKVTELKDAPFYPLARYRFTFEGFEDRSSPSTRDGAT